MGKRKVLLSVCLTALMAALFFLLVPSSNRRLPNEFSELPTLRETTAGFGDGLTTLTMRESNSTKIPPKDPTFIKKA